MRLSLICILFFSIGLNTAFSQEVEITGKVIDGKSQAPIEFATVKLLDKVTGNMLAGTTTQADGTLLLATSSENFSLEISFMGFITQELSDFEVINNKVDLGTIVLEEDSKLMDEVVVQGAKSTTEFKLDKRVFNVGQDLSSTGASALDVLNNIPSVNVNIEGQILLRGTGGVQVLINGKPSVLTSDGGNALGTVTADMIERVEVITNPSAKYNAEGTSGIINIVLKKDEKKGINGSVTLNTGVPNNHSLGFSLNKRTDRFNIFSQLGVGYRTMPEDFETINRNLSDGTRVENIGDAEKNEKFFNLILGSDFYINDKNVITLSGNYAFEGETEYSTGNFGSYSAANTLLSGWTRNESTIADNPKWQYELQYKSDFSDKEDHFLLISAIGSSFAKDQSSEFGNTPTFGEGAQTSQQQTQNDFSQAEYTFQADYTRPFAEKFTLETGGQYFISKVKNNYSISDLEDGIWVVIPTLSNDFDYSQNVLGIYGTGAYEGDKFGLKLGLRMESTDLSTELKQTGESNNQNFTNLFPTLHTSYKLTKGFSVQGGYSRRISRPRFFDLNPFYNIRNTYSVRTGNPNLLPEYTDSYEVTGIFDHALFSLSSSIYHRYITQTVEDVTFSENGINITMPMNIGTNQVTGLEVNGKVTPTQWWGINADFNYNYFDRSGTYESTLFGFTSSQWSSKLTNKFDLPADFTLEIVGDYRSSFQTFQRTNKGYALADIGIRKKIIKGKVIANLSVRDVFASRVQKNEIVSTDFSQYSYRLRGRFITFGVSFGFGKGEAMEFSGTRRRF
ncbi:outer membrane beta-barrel family protein [Algoriphagus zhangzhouensis]|uniref:Outer membrane receptor for ferrienterochelin and colicins n=1 Tax=Algoriphagus zhangzhouensis TaxID=1073327 RepID=A0A1M7ZET0_9BACT|nr:outer membrane beta-barrel family protein [Algoriphagus zhangzhouensis]TDY46069.1 outer membrane receptor for ferrienterochelin and colicin [Algoriphagus zhangzhouensis]SHO63319.1 Outer membrane receptor for ferrienterochelin and colicins [Algoriphagus zhangzhouensis]